MQYQLIHPSSYTISYMFKVPIWGHRPTPSKKFIYLSKWGLFVISWHRDLQLLIEFVILKWHRSKRSCLRRCRTEFSLFTSCTSATSFSAENTNILNSGFEKCSDKLFRTGTTGLQGIWNFNRKIQKYTFTFSACKLGGGNNQGRSIVSPLYI